MKSDWCKFYLKLALAPLGTNWLLGSRAYLLDFSRTILVERKSLRQNKNRDENRILELGFKLGPTDIGTVSFTHCSMCVLLCCRLLYAKLE